MSAGDSSPNSSLSPSVTPNANLANQVPKFGTVIPNRIFVGGIATNTTDLELKTFFSTFGAVKDTKIICDRAGVSKGYGFVTFETQEDADKIIRKEGENFVFKERKLNIGPAVRKQQAYPRLMDGLPGAAGGAAMLITPNAYAYAGGLTVMPGTDVSSIPSLQQQVQPHVAAAAAANYSNTTMMIPQPIYMSQPQYQYATTQMPSQSAQTLQYASQPWVSARCYQPAAGTVTTSQANSYLYSVQPELLYAAAPGAATAVGTQPQILEVTDGTMLDQSTGSDADTRAVSAAVTAATKDSSSDTSQGIPSLMPLCNHTIPPHTLHSYHVSNSSSSSSLAQPPPVKKMSPMPTHIPTTNALQFSQRCYNTPIVVKPGVVPTAKPTILSTNTCPGQRIPGVTMAYVTSAGHKIDDIRMKFENDSHLAASIAPPTPPATPAPASGN